MTQAGSLTVRRDYIASKDTLFRGFTEVSLLNQWWDGECSVEARVGGKFSFGKKFQRGLFYVQGEFLEFDPGKKLVMSWSWNDTPQEVSHCTVHFENSCTDGLSSVRIEHDLSGPKNFCEQGWSDALLALARVDEVAKAEFDWSRFEKRLRVRTSLPDMLRAWTTRSGLESWFLQKAEYFDAAGNPNEEASEGGSYVWTWRAGESESGVVRSLGARHFEFTFGTPVNAKTGEKLEPVVVRVELSEERPGETQLLLQQFNMPVTEAARVGWHMSCRVGWENHLEHLKVLLERGIDLRQ